MRCLPEFRASAYQEHSHLAARHRVVRTVGRSAVAAFALRIDEAMASCGAPLKRAMTGAGIDTGD